MMASGIGVMKYVRRSPARILGESVISEVPLEGADAIANNYVFFPPHFHVPGTSAPGRGTARPFEALLTSMFAGVGMTPSLRDVVQLRNEILHSGLSARPFPELVSMNGNVLGLIREYLLRVLGYTGRFYTGEVGGIEAVIL
jgi:hypothetical protein